jgi:Na+-transporting methylmalonyl-CoA/oxaloacetate decarboxylase gamma subunit
VVDAAGNLTPEGVAIVFTLGIVLVYLMIRRRP